MLLVICLFISYSNFTSVLAKSNSEFHLKGVVYENSNLFEINSDKQLNANSNIDITIKENTVSLCGSIRYKEKEYNFESNGTLYQSPIDYYKDTRITGIINNSSQFKFLHFSIENNADEKFLLKPNKDQNNKTIVRIALKNNTTNDILYFESKINLKVDISSFPIINTSDDKYEDIHIIENWYLPFTQTSNEKMLNTNSQINNILNEKPIIEIK
jgi:hypothetical protein